MSLFDFWNFFKIQIVCFGYSVLSSGTTYFLAIAVLANGDLASGSNDGTIKIWSPSDGSLKKTITGNEYSICALAGHPNGSIISGSLDKIIKIWSCDGQLLRT